MLANHTSIASVRNTIHPWGCRLENVCRAQLFKRMIDQFDRLRKRNAFIDQYKKEKIFENGLEEFDDARYVASLLYMLIVRLTQYLIVQQQMNC